MTAKKLPRRQKISFTILLFASVSSASIFLLTSAALAQSAPVPGGTAGYPYSPPAATQTLSTAGQAAPSGRPGKTKYQDLPLTADSAKYRLDELRALLSVSRPEDVAGSIQELSEWLNDAADAHYRMFLAFAKSDLTKGQANSEKQLNQRFGQLKREAQLLRADLLIKQLRAPEALAPLVDIVAADPRSSTGQQAYKRLVDLGFSQAVAETPKAAATPAPEGPTKWPAMIPAVAPAEPTPAAASPAKPTAPALAKKPAPAKIMTTAKTAAPAQ